MKGENQVAKINDEGMPGIGAGILMPLLKHRWRLRFTGNKSLFSDDILHMMAMQITSCSVDYHLNVLKVVIEQDLITSHLHDFAKRLSSLTKVDKSADGISFVLDLMDGSENVIHSYQFTGCTLIGHVFELDYADSGAVDHKFKFSFKSSKEL